MERWANIKGEAGGGVNKVLGKSKTTCKCNNNRKSQFYTTQIAKIASLNDIRKSIKRKIKNKKRR
jgi:hypothetical protein